MRFLDCLARWPGKLRQTKGRTFGDSHLTGDHEARVNQLWRSGLSFQNIANNLKKECSTCRDFDDEQLVKRVRDECKRQGLSRPKK